jgi:hypothetical protein
MSSGMGSFCINPFRAQFIAVISWRGVQQSLPEGGVQLSLTQTWAEIEEWKGKLLY